MNLKHIVKPLDRYVFSEFWKIFVATGLGFPLMIMIIDLTDNIDTYLGRHLSPARIALSYLFWLPESMFMVLPAAVLFATVFSIGALTRHSEIAAAKASGISFYRLIAPLFAGAVLATSVGLLIGEIAPHASKRRLELLETHKFSGTSERYNFAFAGDAGRVYKIGSLHVNNSSIDGMVIERRGMGDDYPTYVVMGTNAAYAPAKGWTIHRGTMHVIPDSLQSITFSFDSLRDRRFTERPSDLTASPKAPAEMDYRELGRFISALERSGSDVNGLKVERMLKIAIPVTCIVILLFGAPLATSTQRGGAAYGIGISLATTVIFLMLIQLTKAFGAKGFMSPELAAWIPSIVFTIAGVILMKRVRT
jgi:lipopolysaccharide export system permease protein